MIKDNLSKSLSLDLLCGAHCTGVFLLELKHPHKHHVINSLIFWTGNRGRGLIDDRVVRSGGDLHFLRVRCICDIELKGQGFFLKFSLSKTYHLSQQKELKIYKNMNPSFKMFSEKNKKKMILIAFFISRKLFILVIIFLISIVRSSRRMLFLSSLSP